MDTATVPRAIPLADAARALAISPRQARRLVAAGTLPAVRLSDRVQRVPVAALEALLTPSTPAPRAPTP
jgi:hypothetical protein